VRQLQLRRAFQESVAEYDGLELSARQHQDFDELAIKFEAGRQGRFNLRFYLINGLAGF
jgi:hypothetical protein